MKIKLLLVAIMFCSMTFKNAFDYGIGEQTISTNLLNMGDGYNPFSQEGKSNPMVDTGFADDGGEGNKAIFDLVRITNFKQLKKELELNVSTSFSWGVMSGSAQMKTLKEESFNEFSDFLLVKVSVRNEPERLKRSLLKEEAILRLKNYGLENFIAHYGSQYVYSRVTGGYCYLLYKFNSSSKRQRNENRVKIDLVVKKFFGGGGSLNVDVKKEMESLFKTSSVTYNINRLGDNEALPSYRNIDTVIDYLLRFPKIVNNNGETNKYVTLEVKTKSIFTAENFPPEYIERDINNLKRKRYLDKLGRKVLKMHKVNGNLNYIITHADYFNPTDVQKAKVFLDYNTELAIEVENKAQDCAFFLQDCYSLNPDSIIIKDLPSVVMCCMPTPPPKVEPKPIVFKPFTKALNGKARTNQFITEIPLGETRTIEIRGRWTRSSGMAKAEHCMFSGNVEGMKKIINPYQPRPIIYYECVGKLITTDLDGKNKREISIKNETPIVLSGGRKVFVRNTDQYPCYSCKNSPMRIFISK